MDNTNTTITSNNHNNNNNNSHSHSHSQPSSQPAAKAASGSSVEDEDTDMYYLSYDHEYWHNNEQAPAEDVVSLAGGSPTLNTTTTLARGGPSTPGGRGEGGLLVEANEEVVGRLVPVLVMLALVLVLTVLGNALVCLVYRTRFRRNSVNLLVVFLAGMEMVIVCVGVPMEMAVVALPLMFRSQVACKVVRYVETASVCMVLLVLTAIAVDRYLKMSRPANFLSPKWVRGLCLGTVLTALGLALPSFFVFGTKAVPTRVPGLHGVACGLDDSVRSSPVRFVYIALLLLTFAATVVTKIVLYVIMFVRICRRKSATRGGEKVSPARREYPRKHRFVTEDSVSSCGGGEESRRLPTTSSSGSSGLGMASSSVRSGRSSPGVDPARVPLKSGVKESARIGQGASTTVDVQSNRMTWIFFLVSVVTVLTLLPFLALRSLLVLTELLDHLTPLPHPHPLYQLCLRLHLLHAPLIPLLYLCCNHNLRREARHLLHNACLACKKRRPPPTANGTATDPHR